MKPHFVIAECTFPAAWQNMLITNDPMFQRLQATQTASSQEPEEHVARTAAHLAVHCVMIELSVNVVHE